MSIATTPIRYQTMTLRGAAFLALWNDIAPEVDEDYNRWHGTEHVPERLTMPGFLGAHRYVREFGAGQRYFTLYELDSIDALASEAYRHLLANPKPWSARMRPYFSNVMRYGCKLELSRGSTDGEISSIFLIETDQPLVPVKIETLAQECSAIGGAAAVHVGAIDPTLAPLNWSASPTSSLTRHSVMLLVDAEREFDHRAQGASIRESIERNLGRAANEPMIYRAVQRFTK